MRHSVYLKLGKDWVSIPKLGRGLKMKKPEVTREISSGAKRFNIYPQVMMLEVNDLG
ncbi:hypothetical protein VCRA2116O29_170085 [Vibrio crassostreae]|nr:hypothetical protein VCRA2116O29_170085 [Vibrio crassostreae]CAK2540943.1 hypothetical protein VCRA2119O48_60018 [Vibrio crassostreae]CAK3433232.1 hypothetical protein VCRA213O314_30145 [Vibrio crassostreae]CAK3640280.1 hypothetical protein VCRA2123O74_170085 [Vibrio crassostreae]